MMQEFLKTSLSSSKISPDKKYYSRNTNPHKLSEFEYQDDDYQEMHKASRQADVPQLKVLQKQIIKQRPNNVIHFIKSWAQKQLGSTSQQNANDYSDDENEEQGDHPMIKKQKIRRRNAIFEQVDEERGKQDRFEQKSEEIKSIIIVVLRNLQILRKLNIYDLWSLVDETETMSIKQKRAFIRKGDKMCDLIIILQGMVEFYKSANQKPFKTFVSGSSFGDQTILFPTVASGQYIVAQGNAKIARVNSSKIRALVRQANLKIYRAVTRALKRIQLFQLCNSEQFQKLIDTILSREVSEYQEGEEVIRNQSAKNQKTHSFLKNVNRGSLNEDKAEQMIYVVVEGKFGEFQKSISKETIADNQYRKTYSEGEAFGVDILYGRMQNQIVYIAMKNPNERAFGISKVVHLSMMDIERIVGHPRAITKKRNQRI